jgi:acyl-CoA thioesterase I
MSDTPRQCDTHLDIVGFKYPLPNLAQSLKHRRKTRIVAIGSSSTAGEWSQGEIKIVPFPPRLELALRIWSFGRIIDVLNRGIRGQEATDEMSRFEPDVVAEAPALVIWQVGTNAVYREGVYSFDEVAASIEARIDWLAALPMDVVLMDPQYTTALVAKLESAKKMVSLISTAAEKKGVNLFHRFALMEHWCLHDGIRLEELTDPDDDNHLHMSDWATNCVTKALFEAITKAPRPRFVTAGPQS